MQGSLRPDPAHPPAGPMGPLLALLAFALYAGHDVLIRILGETYSVFQIMLFMALFSFPMVLLILMHDRVPGTLRAVYPWWTVARVAAVVISAGGAFYAFTVLPLTQVYAILFAAPLLVTVLAIPVLGERVGLHRGLSVIAGLVGVLIVLRPGAEPLTAGHVAALIAALAGAANGVIVRRVGRQERSAVLIIYPTLGSLVVMAAAQPWVYVPPTLADLAIMALVAAMGFAAMFLTIAAYRRAEAALVAPMQYSQILWASFYGAVLFDESLDLWTGVGAAVIIVSGLYIVFRESRRDVSSNRPVLRTRARAGTLATPQPQAFDPASAEAGTKR